MEHQVGAAGDVTKMPAVAIVGVGGTISTLGATPLDLVDYPDSGRKIEVGAILEFVPQLASVARIIPVQFRSVGSTDLTPADWLDLRAVIAELMRANPDLSGLVVLHGTATLEETAYFLDLTLPDGPTVVLTGAQRPLNALSSDGPMNLFGAVRTAADPASRGRGVLIVMNERIYPARDVTKASTLRLEAFVSEYGPLGSLDPDRIRYHRHSEVGGLTSAFQHLPITFDFPRIDIIYSYAGADETLISAAVARGARGLVSAGFAPGSPSRAERAGFDAALAAGIHIVQCSRAGAGRIGHRSSAAAKGYISGGNLNPQKARILLGLGIAAGGGQEDLMTLFERC